MIKHVYLIKLKEPDTIDAVIQKLKTLPEFIPQIYRLELGKDFTRASSSYDIYQCCEFLSEEDFQAFANHPYHDEVRRYLAEVRQNAVKVDFLLID